jgi:ABC-type phosphate transport system permease subunit
MTELLAGIPSVVLWFWIGGYRAIFKVFLVSLVKL